MMSEDYAEESIKSMTAILNDLNSDKGKAAMATMVDMFNNLKGVAFAPYMTALQTLMAQLQAGVGASNGELTKTLVALVTSPSFKSIIDAVSKVMNTMIQITVKLFALANRLSDEYYPTPSQPNPLTDLGTTTSTPATPATRHRRSIYYSRQ